METAGNENLRIESVRRFNRTITERVGALHDRYLGRGRPIGEARLLWEIGVVEGEETSGAKGDAGAELRALRARLGLDSGYLSRLLRSLEEQKLLQVVTSPGDGRVRRARLTARGRKERDELDRRSNDLAGEILAPLSERQRARLVAAMEEVERLVAASMVEIGVEEPASPDVEECLARYFSELALRFEGGFDPARALPVGDEELRLPHGLVLVARMRGRPIGCVSLKFHGAEPAEIKRMWLAPEVRGLGLGSRLLAELERHAVEGGADRLQLETNRVLTEAIALYRRSGFREVPAYNTEPYGHHWFEKRLTPPE
jgi:DNA-binding MarR family transcriptional regulator/GNAT superfamily N-acetyltransferase